MEVYAYLLLFALPSFFLWREIFRKRIKVDKSRKIATWFATIIVTPIIYAAVLFLYFHETFGIHQKDFNRSQWLADKARRFQMADDIADSKMLIGKDTNEVKQILGNPTWQSDSLHLWQYEMGMGSGGFGFLFHILLLKFKTDKVVSVEHSEVKD